MPPVPDDARRLAYERAAAHYALLRELAGPPGSGKATSLGEVFSRGDYEVTGGRRSCEAFTVIDADEIKGKLIEQARRDGSLESFIKPGVVRDLEADGECSPTSTSPRSCTRSPR